MITAGKSDPLQQAFIEHSAFQCGFCTPGMILASKALLEQHTSPDKHDVKEALAGRYRRCISYYHVVEAASKRG
jgi:aerobic-type carbon monoxide dehydrogenase small subunit (CoxS/CutS family)